MLKSESSSGRGSLGSNNRIVACLTTLYLFAKSRPTLLVEHVQTLQPYMQIQCHIAGDYQVGCDDGMTCNSFTLISVGFQIISNVARTLELAVPLIRHPSEIFLAQLEEDAVKLILQHDKKVVSACLSLLGSVVNNVTKNYPLIRDCFNKYYGQMSLYRNAYEQDKHDQRLVKGGALITFRRALFTVGGLLRHFDFKQEEVYDGLQVKQIRPLPSNSFHESFHLQPGSNTVDEVFETTFFFISHDRPEIQNDALHALGLICIPNHNYMLESKLKPLYIDILNEDFYSVNHKIKVTLLDLHTKTPECNLRFQVLNNLESYLLEEEIRMRKLDEKCE